MLTGFFGMGIHTAEAQIWKKVKDAARYKAEAKVETAASNATDKVIDKAVEGVKGEKKTSSSKNKKETKTSEPAPAPAPAGKATSGQKGNGEKLAIDIKPSSNEIFITGKITLTGRSIKYDGYPSE